MYIISIVTVFVVQYVIKAVNEKCILATCKFWYLHSRICLHVCYTQEWHVLWLHMSHVAGIFHICNWLRLNLLWVCAAKLPLPCVNALVCARGSACVFVLFLYSCIRMENHTTQITAIHQITSASRLVGRNSKFDCHRRIVPPTPTAMKVIHFTRRDLKKFSSPLKCAPMDSWLRWMQ